MKKSRIANTRSRRTTVADKEKETCSLVELEQRQGWYEKAAMGILLLLGVYLSVAYFGQQVVPNSDFTAFVQTGREVLNFQTPSSFKRVPALGILQIILSKFVFGSPHPILTAGLILNCILYTLSILVFYKISRFFMASGISASLALIAALNPWTLAMLVDPIAETTLVFFILLSIYLILKRSWWCYLAVMAASMTRYECFVLIGIAFLNDLIYRQSKREKFRAFGFSCLAAVPMLLWLVGTKTHSAASEGYYKHFVNVESRNGFGLIAMLWKTTFSSLLQWPEWVRANFVERVASKEAASAVMARNQFFHQIFAIAAAIFWGLGTLWSFFKKQWNFLPVLLFWGAYVSAHCMQSVLLDRYTVPVIWLTLLVSGYGFSIFMEWISGKAPRIVRYAILTILACVALVWTFQLWPALAATAKVSPSSKTIVYAGLLLAAVLFIARQIICKRMSIARDVFIFIFMALIIVSNQFDLSLRLGTGDRDIEFRQLAEWYGENAKEGEKLVTTLPGVASLFVPEKQGGQIIHIANVSGRNLQEFAVACKNSGIVYVAWDSRLGFAVNDGYYKSWGLAKIQPLGSGKDVGPFLFIKKIKASEQRYINLYRLDYNLMKQFGL
jgi:hypothetical protein